MLTQQRIDRLAQQRRRPGGRVAFEHELPWDGIVFSAEAVRTLVNKGIFVQRLDLYNAAGQGVTLVGQDGRDLFWSPNTAANAGAGTFTGRIDLTDEVSAGIFSPTKPNQGLRMNGGCTVLAVPNAGTGQPPGVM